MDTFFPPMMITYLAVFRQGFSRPTWVYFQSFIWALLIVEGRKCTSRLVEACFCVDRSLSSFERFLVAYHWDLTEVLGCLVKLLQQELAEQLQVHGAYLLALDTVLVAKAGNVMLGIQTWKDHSGNPDRGEYMVGHHWAIGALVGWWGQRAVSWPVCMRLISGERHPFQYMATADGQVWQATMWDVVVAVVYQIALLVGGLPVHGGPPLRVVADAFFSKAPFLNPLLTAGIDVISKLRHDAVGWDEPGPYAGHGRPRKRGAKWKLADLLHRFPVEEVAVTLYGKACVVRCLVRDMWLREVSAKVRVVAIEGITQPILLMCTDLTLTAGAILQLYAARFSVELAIRDLKQHFGVGDYQCTRSIGILRFVHLCCTSFCLWRLMFLAKNAAWLEETTPGAIAEAPLSFARARRALKRVVLKQIIFSKFAPEPNMQKIQTDLEPLLKIAA